MMLCETGGGGENEKRDKNLKKLKRDKMTYFEVSRFNIAMLGLQTVKDLST